MATGMFGDLPTERPRTSRSRRQHNQSNYESVPAEPSVGERPRTSKGRRSARQRDPVHQSSYVPSAIADGGHPKTRSHAASSPTDNILSMDCRPTTSKGYRDIQDTDFDMVEYEGMERPKTSRGRRSREVDDYMVSNADVAETPSSERPRTSHGKRGRTAQPPAEVGPVYEPPPNTAEVNILKVEDEETKTEDTVVRHTRREGITRPKSRYGQRRQVSQEQQELFSLGHQISHAGPMKATEPQPEWTSVSGSSAFHASPRDTFTPGTPSPRAPTSPNRPISSRPPSSRRRSTGAYEHENGRGSVSPGTSRPTSSGSLSKYSVLPSIPRTPQRRGSTETRELNRQVDKLVVEEDKDGKATPKNNVSKDAVRTTAEIPTLYPKKQATTKKVDAPIKDAGSHADEKKVEVVKEADGPQTNVSPTLMHKALTRAIKLPDEPGVDKPRILLAVKLPSGQRVQRNFSEGDSLNVVLNFAEVSSKIDFTGYHIVCDAPRKIFSDMSVTLGQSGLQNRTVLHIQLPDE